MRRSTKPVSKIYSCNNRKKKKKHGANITSSSLCSTITLPLWVMSRISRRCTSSLGPISRHQADKHQCLSWCSQEGGFTGVREINNRSVPTILLCSKTKLLRWWNNREPWQCIRAALSLITKSSQQPESTRMVSQMSSIITTMCLQQRQTVFRW